MTLCSCSMSGAELLQQCLSQQRRLTPNAAGWFSTRKVWHNDIFEHNFIATDIAPSLRSYFHRAYLPSIIFHATCLCTFLYNFSGTTAALFKFMPRFKAQTEGSVVYYSHTVVLKSVWQRGMSIHASNAPYSSSPDVADVSLPKRLQVRLLLKTLREGNLLLFTANKCYWISIMALLLLLSCIPDLGESRYLF